MRKLGVVAGMLVAGALVVAACGGGGGETPTPSGPTPTRAAPTATPSGVARTPTATRAAQTPTATRAAPTATATRAAPTATATRAAPTATATQAPAPGGDTEAGKQVFISAGCTACHTIRSVPQARGTIGPNLDKVGTIAGQRISGKSAEDYLRESELNPGAFIVQGFSNVMPKLVEPGKQLDDLIAFLMSLK